VKAVIRHPRKGVHRFAGFAGSLMTVIVANLYQQGVVAFGQPDAVPHSSIFPAYHDGPGAIPACMAHPAKSRRIGAAPREYHVCACIERAHERSGPIMPTMLDARRPFLR